MNRGVSSAWACSVPACLYYILVRSFMSFVCEVTALSVPWPRNDRDTERPVWSSESLALSYNRRSMGTARCWRHDEWTDREPAVPPATETDGRHRTLLPCSLRNQSRSTRTIRFDTNYSAHPGVQPRPHRHPMRTVLSQWDKLEKQQKTRVHFIIYASASL